MQIGIVFRAQSEESSADCRAMVKSKKTMQQAICEMTPSVHDCRSHMVDSRRRRENKSQTQNPHTLFYIESPLVCMTPADPYARSPQQDAKHLTNMSHAQFDGIFREEVEKVNDFFLEKQEDFVMEHAQLSRKVTDALTPGGLSVFQLYRLRQRLTDFHGHLISLDNYATMTFFTFRKILKVFDKKTEDNVYSFYISSVLPTPFITSDTVLRLIQTTENQLRQLELHNQTNFTNYYPSIMKESDEPMSAPEHIPPISRSLTWSLTSS